VLGFDLGDRTFCHLAIKARERGMIGRLDLDDAGREDDDGCPLEWGKKVIVR